MIRNIVSVMSRLRFTITLRQSTKRRNVSWVAETVK
jgi:hypothetical protein